MRIGTVLVILLSCIATPALAGDGGQSAQVKGADLDLLKEVRDVAARIEKSRGDTFTTPPLAVRASREACRKAGMERAAAVLETGQLEARGRAWEDIGLGEKHSPILLLGWIAADLDGVTWDPDSGRLLIGYDRFTDSDFFPSEAGEDATTLLVATGVRPDEPLVIHNLVHLLQRQRSGGDWLAGLESTDRILAASAMAEGEANLVAVRYMFTAIGLQDDVLSHGLGPQEVLDGLLVPEPLLSGAGAEHDFLDFIYIEGFSRLSDSFGNGGWESVNGMIRRCRTTRDVLHPERPAWKPLSLGEPGIKVPDRYRLVDRDMLGEQAVIQLISSLTGKDNLGLLAGDGWRGDALYRWEDPDSPDTGITLWRTAWDREEDAVDFTYGFGRGLTSRYGMKPGSGDDVEGCIDLPGDAGRTMCVYTGDVIDVIVGPSGLVRPESERPTSDG